MKTFSKKVAFKMTPYRKRSSLPPTLQSFKLFPTEERILYWIKYQTSLNYTRTVVDKSQKKCIRKIYRCDVIPSCEDSATKHHLVTTNPPIFTFEDEALSSKNRVWKIKKKLLRNRKIIGSCKKRRRQRAEHRIKAISVENQVWASWILNFDND